jgi:hypothetical protein
MLEQMTAAVKRGMEYHKAISKADVDSAEK